MTDLGGGPTGAQPAESGSVGSAANGSWTDGPQFITVNGLDHDRSCGLFAGAGLCSCGAVVAAVLRNPGGSA